jgi:ribosome-associated heat shock protein Hsp15
MEAEQDSRAAALRVDKWLWFTRFFKSRSQATEAVTGGLVHVNDERTKPSRELRAGDRLIITRSETRFEVIVTGIPQRRGPAAEAVTFYSETSQSVTLREQRREQSRHAPPAPDGRPDKHDRRLLRDLRRG